ncbi:AF4/FMR2 family member 1 isoform X2 [Trichomycterus rosablanca]|uniref:AF4/FMR2 family member 1 isoform X2 n=1 Tax=Trichomycterus rosablanca TaxID=2290929 RepID=UPI002F360731
MAAQSSLREELNVLRRKEWERRNQEALQDKELYQESTPLFGEPYKTYKGDELSIRIQRMLGNYEDGNNFQYTEYDRTSRDQPPVPSYGHSGRPDHKDNTNPSFQSSSSYGGAKPVHTSRGSVQQSKKHLIPNNLNKDAPPERHQQKTESWGDLPPVLPDLSPPADPLSPLHSSDSEQEMNHDNDDHSFSPERNNSFRTIKQPHHSEVQLKEIVGDVPLMTSQALLPPLSSKPNLANSRKPTALVPPLDRLNQVPSESPELKPSPEHFHEESYESLSDLKQNRPSLPPLKMPSQTAETLSNEVQRVNEILREMTHLCPPLLTAIQTPSTAEPSKFSFPNKPESHVLSGYQQPQKHHETRAKTPLSPVRPDPVVCEDVRAAVSAPPSGGESASSSDSESSSESESDSESSESGAEETPAAPTNSSPAKTEGPKDINWQLISWIKESQQNLNPQNHSDRVSKHDTKPTPGTKPWPHPHAQEESKPRPKRHHNSHGPPAQPERDDAESELKPAASTQHTGPRHSSDACVDAGERKTTAEKRPKKSRKPQSSLHVESVEVTPRNTEATFTERPKVKTKSTSSHEKKPDSRKSSGRSASEKKSGKDAPSKIVKERKEAHVEPVRLPVPPPKSTTNETPVSSKSLKKSQARSPRPERKSDGLFKPSADPPLTLVVKIQLSQLSRVPKAPRTRTSAHSEAPAKKPGHEKDSSKVGKKRAAEHDEPSVPIKKQKLEKPERERKTSLSSQHNTSGKTELSKSSHEDRNKKKEKEKEKKSTKKDHPASPHPPAPPAPHSSGHKRRSGEAEESGRSSSKHKKKSSGKEEHSRSNKKAPKICTSTSETASSSGAPATHRPLLKFEDKHYSVDHHMKEAKKLKHKADAMVDKMGKAFNYLDAAMSFVESGISMETDPQTPKSAYAMFSDTVDLIRFILKLKNYLDPSAPASERDFLVLCMQCQALLQMAMFRCKKESALKYSRTLTDYFKSSKTVHAPSPCISNSSPGSPMPSPAGSAASNPSGSSSTVSIPQLVQQMASSYVSITALVLSAHESWEQSEELSCSCAGVLKELDAALGPLSLTSSMNSLVRYTRQGLHWLKLDSSRNPHPGP